MFFTEVDFVKKCRQLVANYVNEHLDQSDVNDGKVDLLEPAEVYMVWYSKSLQNHKGLFSTPLADGMYYEITYNGDKNELYFDAYKKFQNIKHTNIFNGF